VETTAQVVARKTVRYGKAPLRSTRTLGDVALDHWADLEQIATSAMARERTKVGLTRFRRHNIGFGLAVGVIMRMVIEARIERTEGDELRIRLSIIERAKIIENAIDLSLAEGDALLARVQIRLVQAQVATISAPLVK
jgi:hypothetical protein